jgi:hypothetical protein
MPILATSYKEDMGLGDSSPILFLFASTAYFSYLLGARFLGLS